MALRRKSLIGLTLKATTHVQVYWRLCLTRECCHKMLHKIFAVYTARYWCQLEGARSTLITPGGFHGNCVSGLLSPNDLTPVIFNTILHVVLEVVGVSWCFWDTCSVGVRPDVFSNMLSVLSMGKP